MFINTKILSLITLLLFSGAVYGAYNYWQSNVPPKQTFLLQGFEQTLGAVDEQLEERNEKEFTDFKTLVEKHKRGMELLEQMTKVRVLTKALYISLDSLFAINANVTQIATKTNDYQKQVLAFYPFEDSKELNFAFATLLNPQLMQQSSNDFTSVAQKQLKVRVNQAKTTVIDKILNRITMEPMAFYIYCPAVQPNAQQLNIGDTLQLKIYSSLFQSSYPKYCFNFEDKSLEIERDGTARYKTVCNKVGEYRLKGFAQAADNEYIPDIPFEMPYTVEACR